MARIAVQANEHCARWSITRYAALLGIQTRTTPALTAHTSKAPLQLFESAALPSLNTFQNIAAAQRFFYPAPTGRGQLLRL